MVRSFILETQRHGILRYVARIYSKKCHFFLHLINWIIFNETQNPTNAHIWVNIEVWNIWVNCVHSESKITLLINKIRDSFESKYSGISEPFQITKKYPWKSWNTLCTSVGRFVYIWTHSLFFAMMHKQWKWGRGSRSFSFCRLTQSGNFDFT